MRVLEELHIVYLLPPYSLLYSKQFDLQFSYIIHTGRIKYCLSIALNSSLKHTIAPVPLGTDALSLQQCSFRQSKMYYEHITALYNAPVTVGNVETEKYFDKIYELVRSSGAEEVCSELIYHLLIELINSHGYGSEERDEAFRIKVVLMYISDHYASDLNVTGLAEIAHLSRCHFSTEFKRHTGFSPYSYILKYRISAAKRMLCSTERTVDMIAERCGFTDTSSFIRAFKKTEDISPAAYRKIH